MNDVFRVFLAYHDYVTGLAIRFAPCSDLADDIVQDVFSEFAKEYDGEEESETRLLLYRLTRRVSQRHYRKKMQNMPSTLRKIGEFLARQGQSIAEPPQYQSEIEALKSCIERLPKTGREVINLHYFENIPLKEIAQKKEIRGETLRQNMTRIRRKLKDCVALVLQSR